MLRNPCYLTASVNKARINKQVERVSERYALRQEKLKANLSLRLIKRLYEDAPPVTPAPWM
jgi:hypothetical protein